MSDKDQPYLSNLSESGVSDAEKAFVKKFAAELTAMEPLGVRAADLLAKAVPFMDKPWKLFYSVWLKDYEIYCKTARDMRAESEKNEN